ncbi:MAG: hypothetical protein WBL88_00165 [Nitrososphaeraceae archaeon]
MPVNSQASNSQDLQAGHDTYCGGHDTYCGISPSYHGLVCTVPDFFTVLPLEYRLVATHMPILVSSRRQAEYDPKTT